MNEVNVGDELWCFSTRSCDWYGAYSTDWIELICINAKPRMCKELLETNMYFRSKDEAIESMLSRMEKIKEMKFHKPKDFK